MKLKTGRVRKLKKCLLPQTELDVFFEDKTDRQGNKYFLRAKKKKKVNLDFNYFTELILGLILTAETMISLGFQHNIDIALTKQKMGNNLLRLVFFLS